MIFFVVPDKIITFVQFGQTGFDLNKRGCFHIILAYGNLFLTYRYLIPNWKCLYQLRPWLHPQCGYAPEFLHMFRTNQTMPKYFTWSSLWKKSFSQSEARCKLGIKIALNVITFLINPQENISGKSGDLACICSRKEVNNVSRQSRGQGRHLEYYSEK